MTSFPVMLMPQIIPLNINGAKQSVKNLSSVLPSKFCTLIGVFSNRIDFPSCVTFKIQIVTDGGRELT
jgi:hypothetical protein